MRGRRPRIRMRSSRPTTSTTGPTGTITSMTGPAGIAVTGTGVAMAGSTAGGIRVRGLRTTARVATAPAGIAVTGPAAGGIGGMAGSTAGGIRVRGFGTAVRATTAPVSVAVTGPTGAITGMTGPAGIAVTGAGVAMAGSTAAGIRVRGLGTTTSVTATGIRMRGRRIRCRVRGSRPIASMAGPAGVGMAGSTAGGSGVRGFGTAARVPGPAGIGVAGPAGAGVAGAAGAGVGAGGGVGGCCGGVGGLGGLGVGMAGEGIETVISSHARTSTSRRGVGRCSRHCWNGARERIQTMISPRTRPGRRALVTTATGGRARFGFPALGADPTITASARARGTRPGRLTTGRLTAVPAAGRLTTVTAAGRLTTGRLTTVPGVPTSAVTGAGVRGVVTGAGVRGAATGTSSRASAPSAPRGTTKTTVDPLPDTMPRPHSEPIRRLTSRSKMTQKSLQPPRHRLDLAQQLGQSLKRRNQIINMPPHNLHLLGHPGTDLSHHRRSPQPETEHLFQHRLAEHAERLGDRITHHVMNELDNKPGDPQTSGDTMSQIPQRLQSSRQVRSLGPPRVSRLTDLALHIPLDRVPQALRLLFKMIRNIHPRLRARPHRVRIPGQLVKNLRKRVNMLQNPPSHRPNSRGQRIERQRHNIARQTRARQRPLSPRPIANRSRQIGNILTQTRPRPKR